jgi:predicted enzyme related to lactoylglutathione lyase
MDLRLLVLRTPYPKRLSEFYGLLGLSFDYHQHGNSPFHYSTMIGQTVLEIYPLTKSQTEVDKNLRLGFAIDHFDETINRLTASGIVFSQEPTQTEFGFIAVIVDPAGRKIELYKK